MRVPLKRSASFLPLGRDLRRLLKCVVLHCPIKVVDRTAGRDHLDPFGIAIHIRA